MVPGSRWYAISFTARSHQEPYVGGLDRWTSIRPDNAAPSGCHCGQLEIEMGAAEAVHDGRFCPSCDLPVRARLDKRVGRNIRDR